MQSKKTVAGAGLLGIGVLTIVLLVKGLYPVDLPASHDPDFIDVVFDNRGVI